MITEEHKKLAKIAVRERFGCDGKYKCVYFEDCMFGDGCNTSYDCCECGADDFYEGFLEGLEASLKVLGDGKVTG